MLKGGGGAPTKLGSGPFVTTNLVFSSAEMMNQVHDFSSACSKFNEDVDMIRNDENVSQKLTTVRLVMDKVMNIERAFILPEGLPGRPFYK